MEGTEYVVGFDGSEGAKAALRWALAAAAPDGAAVEAVAVRSTPVAAVNPWVPLPSLDDAALDASFREHLRQALADVGGVDAVGLRVVNGSAGPAVVEAAARARCLVVGRRGHGGFAGLLLGSVADHCLRRARGPVALVPVTDGGAPDGAVVVGVDGSEGSDAAVRFAASEADRLGRPLVAVHAWDWLDQPDVFSPGFDAAAARRYATAALARSIGERPVEIVVVNDTPARALMERSAAGDLVVVGNRGLGAVQQALVGSVSRQLAHHAPSTVVVVHATT